jgi:dolichol-phosphate mannosyltransferase
MRDFTVIIPTLNEERNIGKLVTRLVRLYPQIRIIVADDGSTDATQRIVSKIAQANPLVKLLDRSRESVHGLTASVIDAVKQTETRHITIMDGDFQHPPERIRAFAKLLHEGKHVAVGTRAKISVPWAAHRKCMSKFATHVCRLRLKITGAATLDPLSGFFATRRDLFVKYVRKAPNRFEPRGYKVLFDFLKQLPSNTPLAEVPFNFDTRKQGSSKMNSRHIFYFLRGLLK